MKRPRIVPWISWLTVALGCVDIEPVVVVVPRFDGGAGIGDGDPGRALACMTCLETPSEPGPGCGNVWTICQSDEPCRRVMECAAPLRCFELPTPNLVNECGLGCFNMVLMGTFPPVTIAALVDLQTCAQQGPCGPTCLGAADGGAAD